MYLNKSSNVFNFFISHLVVSSVAYLFYYLIHYNVEEERAYKVALLYDDIL